MHCLYIYIYVRPHCFVVPLILEGQQHCTYMSKNKTKNKKNLILFLEFPQSAQYSIPEAKGVCNSSAALVVRLCIA